MRLNGNSPDLPPIVILRLRNMTAIDATGLHALEELADKLQGERPGVDPLRCARSAAAG